MRKGFTLIELLIVLAVIGVLGAALMVRAVNLSPSAKNKRAYNDLRNIKLAVEAYVADYGYLPTTSDNSSDLENALVNAKKRLIDYIPNDVWKPTGKYGWKVSNGYYVIYSVGQNGSGGPSVSSTGGGEVTGGDGDDIWVSNCKTSNTQLPE